jgi:hypothetical protein
MPHSTNQGRHLLEAHRLLTAAADYSQAYRSLASLETTLQFRRLPGSPLVVAALALLWASCASAGKIAPLREGDLPLDEDSILNVDAFFAPGVTPAIRTLTLQTRQHGAAT